MKYTLFLPLVLLFSCAIPTSENHDAKLPEKQVYETGSFGDDYQFLNKYNPDLVLLKNGDAQVAVAPALQGRVMTSSANGMQGTSYGWINRAHYESGEINPQINVYGGEERFWLGPEGGQYSIFFKEGSAFTFENWFTPKLIDLEPFVITEQTDNQVAFTKSAALVNYSGYTFNFQIDRTVDIVSNAEMLQTLGLNAINDLKSVGYKTTNKLKNISLKSWTKENGLLSIWLLGMLKHSETTTVVVPYVQGKIEDLGNIVNDDYFGKVPSERLVVKDKVIFFKGDGKERGKIGLSPLRAKDMIGSYDAENNTLTLVKYNKPQGVLDYVNSKWEMQKKPYSGDVLNSYNDGPVEPGAKPLGPFYELESSSPAAALKPNEAITHIQYTFHFEGKKEDLDLVAQSTLGVSLDEIMSVFQK